MISEALTPKCVKSVFQILVVMVVIGLMTYEAMTPQCGRSVFQAYAFKSQYYNGKLLKFKNRIHFTYNK